MQNRKVCVNLIKLKKYLLVWLLNAGYEEFGFTYTSLQLWKLPRLKQTSLYIERQQLVLLTDMQSASFDSIPSPWRCDWRNSNCASCTSRSAATTASWKKRSKWDWQHLVYAVRESTGHCWKVWQVRSASLPQRCGTTNCVVVQEYQRFSSYVSFNSLKFDTRT